MKLFVFAVRDMRAQIFNNPVVNEFAQVVVRDFQNLILRSGSVMSECPGDFGLYEIGTFDRNTSRFESTDPKLLCMGSDFVKPLGASSVRPAPAAVGEDRQEAPRP